MKGLGGKRRAVYHNLGVGKQLGTFYFFEGGCDMKRLNVFWASILFLVLSCFSVSFLSAGPEGLDRFLGYWIIDQQATLENAPHSPKYSVQDDGPRMPEMIAKIADRMSLEVTPTEIIYYQGSDQNAPSRKVPFIVDVVEAEKVVLKTESAGQEVYLTLTLAGDRQMNFRSSQTDDLDFYIWRKAEE